MKKIVLCLLALFSLNITQAQEEDGSVYGSLGVYEAQKEYYTLVSDANLREKPATSAKVITTLPIATKIKIEEVTTDSLLLNGYRAPWCKITLTLNGKKLSGFMWGGFIATLSLASPVTEGVVYVIGVSSWDEKKHRMALQLRATKANKELSKVDINGAGDVTYTVHLKSHYQQSFKGVKEALSVETGYEACGYPWTNDLVFWTGQKLVAVLQTSSISEGGVFSSSEDYILPHDKGGLANHILLSKEDLEYAETSDGTDYTITKQKFSLSLFKWNGVKLEKFKEIK